MGGVLTGALIAAGASIIASGIGGLFAKKSATKQRDAQKDLADQARQDKLRLQRELETLEENRQPVINPYEGVADLSSMITDTSGGLSNPFATIGVSTSAAEMQAEEADIALANILDMLQASGASAGGATALAQAALKSKKGVSASIEQQEAQNEKLRVQGEQTLQTQKMAEQQRLQSAKYTEAGRLQQADVAGREFVYGQTERRQGEQLNRLQAQVTGQTQQEMAYNSNAAQASAIGTQAISSAVSAGVGALSTVMTAPGVMKEMGTKVNSWFKD